MSNTTSQIDFLLHRAVAQVEKEAELRTLLMAGGRTGRPLRVKLGFDPSKPDLTLGHAVVLRKLRQFQDLGHQAVVIVGDWTARLGDPTGKDGARAPLTAAEVQANAATYLEQFFTVVDASKTEIRWQSEWFNTFTLADVFHLGYQKTVAQMLKRDHFEKRYTSGNEIYLSEFLYPLLQGYDSLAVAADVEIGGTDQTYNLLVGRELQERQGKIPQAIVTCKLIVGLDGVNKMSKSLGNYIALTADPQDMYGKLMSLPDATMLTYFEGLTDVPADELAIFSEQMAYDRVNPRDIKMRLAREVVTTFHSADAATEAEAAFKRQFQQSEWPTTMAEIHLTAAQPLVDVIAQQLQVSKSVVRRLIAQGGISLRRDGVVARVTDVTTQLTPGQPVELKMGKLDYVRILTTPHE